MKHANVSIFVPHEGCPHMCSFCNQRTITGLQGSSCTSETADATIKLALSHLQEKSKYAEIAFFGGSFTAIERSRMMELLETAYPYVRDGLFAGIRVSTRPDAIDGEILEILKNHGVTMVELGAQSMRDDVLLANLRGHTAQDVRRASALIKEHGIGLGLQMMTGLYRDNDDGAVYTAEEIIKLRPDNVRIYPTVVLKNTMLEELMDEGKYRPQSTAEAVKLCAVLLRMFYAARIDVIRVGLHSGGGVEDGYVAGAYHPAFRELCEGEIYFNEAAEKLRGLERGNRTILVKGSEVSKMIGQSKVNIVRLREMGYNCRVNPAGVENHVSEKYTVEVI